MNATGRFVQFPTKIEKDIKFKNIIILNHFFATNH